MSKRIAFWIFLIGTLTSSALFLFLTFDTQRQVLAVTDLLSLRPAQAAAVR